MNIEQQISDRLKSINCLHKQMESSHKPAYASPNYPMMVPEQLNEEMFYNYKSQCLGLIEMLYGKEHFKYTEFIRIMDKLRMASVTKSLGLIDSIEADLQNGWLTTVRGLITAEVFSNFLEMAEHLLEQTYKDAAAVMIGSVLEDHLRQLCIKNGISLTDIKPDGNEVVKKADRMNSDLKNANVYNSIVQKSITALFGIRNDAAHGNYEKYTKEQVVLMLATVQNIMIENPL